MNQAKTTRLAELEKIDTQKKLGSKSGYRNWITSAYYFELTNLRTQLHNEQITTTAAPRRNWRNDPATEKQLIYLNKLGVVLEDGMTKGRASELIDATRDNSLTSIGGKYYRGGN